MAATAPRSSKGCVKTARIMDEARRLRCLDVMNAELPNTTLSTDADLFREEAERALYAAAMTDKAVIDRLHEIAALYETLAAGQDIGPPIVNKWRAPARY